MIAARKMDQLKTVQEEIRLLGGICDTMVINIRDPVMTSKLIEDIVTKYGKLNCLVVKEGYMVDEKEKGLTSYNRNDKMRRGPS